MTYVVTWNLVAIQQLATLIANALDPAAVRQVDEDNYRVTVVSIGPARRH